MDKKQLFNYCEIVDHKREHREKYPAIKDVYFVDVKYKRKVQMFGIEKEISILDVWQVNHN